MLQIIGTVSSVESELVKPEGREPFTSTTIVLLSGDGRKDFVRLGRDFPASEVPSQGDAVTLAVWPRPYVKKSDNSLGCGFTAYARVKAPSLV